MHVVLPEILHEPPVLPIHLQRVLQSCHNRLLPADDHLLQRLHVFQQSTADKASGMTNTTQTTANKRAVDFISFLNLIGKNSD